MAGDDLERRAPVEQRIRPQPLSDQIAEKLRQRILDGQIGDGEKLPTLGSLTAEFGVSKPSIRDALRILEAEGLVTVQRGKVGGSVVHTPRPANAAYTIQLVLESMRVGDADVSRALDLLEPVCAAQCADSPRRKAIVAKLAKTVSDAEAAEADGDFDTFVEMSRRFHEELIRECGNDTLVLLIGALQNIWRDRMAARGIPPESANRKEDWPFAEEANRTRALDDHRLLLRLIERGDSEAVARETRHHMIWVEDIWFKVDGRGRPRARERPL